MTTELRLTEALAATSGNAIGKRWRARIIEADRWGSSAYYPADVLERDGSRVFTEGLAMYANHPTSSEEWERPERSIHDMVGKLISEAVYEADNPEGAGLYADVEFYDSFLTEINEKHQDVGLSVRATGLTEDAEMDGRFGPVLLGLLAADSVDVVTRAGAGGKLTSILESDRDLAGRPLSKKETVTDVTKEDFDALQTALTEAITKLGTSLAESFTPGAVELSAEDAELLNAAKAAQAEAEANKETPVEVDAAAVATAVVEAGLPTTSIAKVHAEVVKGTALEEAVKAEDDYIKSAQAKLEQGNIQISESGRAGALADAVKLLG